MRYVPAEKARSVHSPTRLGAGMCVFVCAHTHTHLRWRVQDMKVCLLRARAPFTPACVLALFECACRFAC